MTFKKTREMEMFDIMFNAIEKELFKKKVKE